MNYTPIQLKLPVDLERIIEVNDPVYTFNEVVAHIDLKKYFAEKDCKAAGRPRYDREKRGEIKIIKKTHGSHLTFRKMHGLYQRKH